AGRSSRRSTSRTSSFPLDSDRLASYPTFGGAMSVELKVNGNVERVDVDPDTPLLWVLRDTLKLRGTKFGCGKGLCGACTVHVDGVATRSCSVPCSSVKGSVTTIEGLDPNGAHPVQKAWIEADVPQCGYCQPGQIMACAALLKANPSATAAEVAAGMTNL